MNIDFHGSSARCLLWPCLQVFYPEEPLSSSCRFWNKTSRRDSCGYPFLTFYVSSLRGRKNTTIDLFCVQVVFFQQTLPPMPIPANPSLMWFFFYFLTRVISDRLILWKFVFDVCMFCVIFVSGLILWILKKFAVSWLSCGINRRWIDAGFQPWCKSFVVDWPQSTNQLILKNHSVCCWTGFKLMCVCVCVCV